MTAWNLIELNQNTLKIMLGLELVKNRDEIKFNAIASQLGEDIEPFIGDFRQAQDDNNAPCHQLLELTLKASIILGKYHQTNMVIDFAKEHNYLLSVDEQTIWYLVD